MDQQAIDARVFEARMAELAERYDEMAAAVKAFVEAEPKLDEDERGLLSVAYKNNSYRKRKAIALLKAIEGRETEKQSEDDASRRVARELRVKIERELDAVCDEVLDLLDRRLIANVPDAEAEAKVFYYKLKGDFNKYKTEIQHGAEMREKTVNAALAAYKSGRELARTALSAAHPVRLEANNNLAVFYYEVLLSPERAIQLSREAIDQAVEANEKEHAEFEDDARVVLQLLKENLDHWTGEEEEESQ